MDKNKNIKFIVYFIIILYIIYKKSNKNVVKIVFVFGIVIFIIKQLPPEVDKQIGRAHV